MVTCSKTDDGASGLIVLIAQSRSIRQIYWSTDEDQASTLITDLPLSVRVSGVERKGRLQLTLKRLTNELGLLTKHFLPDSGISPFSPDCRTVVFSANAKSRTVSPDMAGIKPALLFIHCGGSGVVAVVYVEKLGFTGTDVDWHLGALFPTPGHHPSLQVAVGETLHIGFCYNLGFIFQGSRFRRGLKLKEDSHSLWFLFRFGDFREEEEKTQPFPGVPSQILQASTPRRREEGESAIDGAMERGVSCVEQWEEEYEFAAVETEEYLCAFDADLYVSALQNNTIKRTLTSSACDSRQQNLIRAFSPTPINSNPIPRQHRKDEENNYDIPGIKSLVMSLSPAWKYDLLQYKLWDLLSVCLHLITAVVFTGSHLFKGFLPIEAACL
ncbi:hypothetical protein E1301_Tti012647 [Triplophysa tibetana]|uniref:Uncharacterized protein n=1 Tax=Triplophysa tibetana TaxID=1572043 RepID=A0A5A9PNJ6_9TELE|nr:hypothetical protein E1301_Tti012647 [Triplophysa tibetana]